jgi:hypothetical protein
MKPAAADNADIRQLLFSRELQVFFESLSEDRWSELAAECTESLLTSGLHGAPPLGVPEVKQLGRWLSAEEYCGDSYIDISSPSSSESTTGRGIRANRGQPPVLTSISTMSASSNVSKKSELQEDNKDSKKTKRGAGRSNDAAGDDCCNKAKRHKSGGIDNSGNALEVGDERVGTVRNVTAFGVFLDIGASRDGLLHNSEFLSNRSTSGCKKQKKFGSKGSGGGDSSSLVLGATVRVKVKSIDTARDRISLTQIDS